MAQGVKGTQVARAVVAWLLNKLGATLPIVQTEPGSEDIEKMRDWARDPAKR